MTVFQNLSPPFFPPQASIVTVIRLVNDAVDTIESEGTMFHPLCVSLLTLLLSQSGSGVFSYMQYTPCVLHTQYRISTWTLLGTVHRLAPNMLTEDFFLLSLSQLVSPALFSYTSSQYIYP